MMMFLKPFNIPSKPVIRYGTLPVTLMSPLNQSSGPTRIPTSTICMKGRSFRSRMKWDQWARSSGDLGRDSDRGLGLGLGRDSDRGLGLVFDRDSGSGGGFGRGLGLFLDPFHFPILIVRHSTHFARIIINRGLAGGNLYPDKDFKTEIEKQAHRNLRMGFLD
jgi:hypothetical protein